MRDQVAPLRMVHEVLAERGYDAALARSRAASPRDPFAFHLALGRLGDALLIGAKVGRPKQLADVLARFVPVGAKLPSAVATLLRTVGTSRPAAWPAIVRQLGSPRFADAFFEAALGRALTKGPSAARLAAAELVAKRARDEMTMFYYPFLCRPELTEALVLAAQIEKPGPTQDAAFGALVALDRYIVDVRARPLLRGALTSPSPAVRCVAARALLRHARASAWPKEVFADVIALVHDDDGLVRARTIFALNASDDRLSDGERSAVTVALESRIDDPLLEVRINVLTGLARRKGAAFRLRARELLKKEKNAKVRLVLQRICEGG